MAGGGGAPRRRVAVSARRCSALRGLLERAERMLGAEGAARAVGRAA